ncbi:MAG: JAB domain-containing protein [Steroidobacteraceae bacterium]
MSRNVSLYCLDATGTPVPASPQQVIAAAREHLSRRVRRGSPLSSPEATTDYLTLKLGDRDFESFCCLFLDSRLRVIEFVELFRGTIDGAAVHPREVVREALAPNAAAVVFCHGHPSGIAEPSHADELITRRLVDALQLVQTRVVDHILGGLSFVTRCRDISKLRHCSSVKAFSGKSFYRW